MGRKSREIRQGRDSRPQRERQRLSQELEAIERQRRSREYGKLEGTTRRRVKDLYSAEKQIVKALPKIIRGSASEELKAAITEHLETTKDQVTRLEEVFGQLEEKPKAKHCKGMEGLLQEGAECLKEEDKGTVRDLQLIGAAQRVEHYEVSAYGTAKAMAEKLGLSKAVALLKETEEEEADHPLGWDDSIHRLCDAPQFSY